MPRPEDIALRNMFETSDNTGKQNIFREIFNYTLEDLRDGSFLAMSHDNVIYNINSLLSVLSSADRTSPEITAMIDRYTERLSEMRNNNTYSDQREYIDILLNFLHPQQSLVNSIDKLHPRKDYDEDPTGMTLENLTSSHTSYNKVEYTPNFPLIDLTKIGLSSNILLPNSDE